MSGAVGGDIVTVHAISNHRIDVVSEREARSSAYVTLFVADKSAPPPSAITPFIIGAYHDIYVETMAGWRLARRVFEPLIATAP